MAAIGWHLGNADVSGGGIFENAWNLHALFPRKREPFRSGARRRGSEKSVNITQGTRIDTIPYNVRNI
jgi:hypothetical protein